MAEVSPFPHVRPLAADQVHGRDSEVADLVAHIVERRPVAVIGPRRYGKTSLVRRAMKVATDVEPIPTVTVDCFSVTSAYDLAVRFEQAAATLTGPAARLLSDLFAGSELGLSLGAGLGLKAKIGSKNAPEPLGALHALLDGLVRTAAKHGLILFLDEFQDLAGVDGAEGLLRSHLQHTEQIALVVAGSAPSMMRRLFADRARPFYGQAEMLELGPLSRRAATGIVVEGFEATGRQVGLVADRVVAFAAGHPQRLMLLADRLWRLTEADTTATDAAFAAALKTARDGCAVEFPPFWAQLPPSSRDALRAVASFGTPNARAGQRYLELNPNAAATAAGRLLDDGILVRDDRHWRIVDPFLADWITATFP